MTWSVRVQYEVMKMMREENIEIPETVAFDQFVAFISRVDQIFHQKILLLICDREVVTEDNFQMFVATKRVFTVRICS